MPIDYRNSYFTTLRALPSRPVSPEKRAIKKSKSSASLSSLPSLSVLSDISALAYTLYVNIIRRDLQRQGVVPQALRDRAHKTAAQAPSGNRQRLRA